MTTLDLLHAFEQLDIKLWCEGDALKFDAPEGTMTIERINLLKQHKPDLLAHLSHRSQGSNKQINKPQFIEPLDPVNDESASTSSIPALLTPWERLKQRAMGAYDYQLKQATNNLIKNGYDVNNAMVYRLDWHSSIQRVLHLSHDQIERLESELIKDGILAFEGNRSYLVLGNGVPLPAKDQTTLTSSSTMTEAVPFSIGCITKYY